MGQKQEVEPEVCASPCSVIQRPSKATEAAGGPGREQGEAVQEAPVPCWPTRLGGSNQQSRYGAGLPRLKCLQLMYQDKFTL